MGVDEPNILRKTKVVKREKEEEKKENIKLKHHDFESEPLDSIPEMKGNIKLNKPSDIHSDEKKKSKKIKVTKKATESEVLSPLQDKESPFEKESINEEQARVIKTKDHEKVVQGTNQVGFEPSKEKVDRKERDPIAVPGAAISKKHSDFEKVEPPTYLNYPSEQGISIVPDEINNDVTDINSNVEVISEQIHEDSDEKQTSITDFREIPIIIEKDQTKRTKKVTKKTVTENQPVIEEPKDEIIKSLENMTIEEASEKDIVFDKSKVNSIPI